MIKTSGLRERTRANRAAAKIRRNGGGSVTTYGIAQGLRKKEAESVAGTLRGKLKELGIEGEAHTFYRGGKKIEGSYFTPYQIADAALIYNARKALYKEAIQGLRNLTD